MLITQKEEIEIFLPSSVLDGAEGMLTLMEDSEETYLLPVLGRPLFDYIQQEYDQLSKTEDWLLPKNGAGEIPVEKLIRISQEIVVYMTLANSAGLFSVSINDAGLNTPTTQGYEASDEKRIERFVKDAYMKGHRAIDRLLLFLEEDATSPEYTETNEGKEQTGRIFTSLWKSSRYFYQNQDTLFLTSGEFNRYVYIGDSREKFISLLADIRYCQDTFLCPQVGYDLMEAFIASQTDLSFLPEKEDDLKVWKNSIRMLRSALALYTENRNEKMQRKSSRNEADLALERTKKYIQKHQSSFGEYIKESPLYTSPTPSLDAGTGNDTADMHGSDKYRYDPEDENNAVHSLYFFNRIP